MGKFVIAGGTGFIGRKLLEALSKRGDEAVVLSRHGRPGGAVRHVHWDAKSLGKWVEELEGATAVVNLCGAPVSVPWTEANRRLILESRVESTSALSAAIRTCKRPPAVWVNGSAVGIYGDRGDEILDEASPPGSGFLADVCAQWEAAATEHALVGTRIAILRIGVALGRDGGALIPLRRVVRGFLGGSVGSGRQWAPWIHVEDLAALILWIVDGDISGVVVGAAPDVVTNRELMSQLRKAYRRPWAPPIPSIALTLASRLGGPDSSLLLDSVRAVPKAALASGFEYRYPTLAAALQDLC